MPDMPQIAHKVLWFDRFALDLTRGCLRAGGEDIELRPKAFEVLRHLAANAGVLVPKQDLSAAVWPNVTVSDDSLVQCIRELRLKLGDSEHSLIKTVSRRGYLLDAAVRTSPDAPAAGPAAFAQYLREGVTSLQAGGSTDLVARILALARQAWEAPRHALLLAAFAIVCVIAAAAALLALGASNTGTSLAAATPAPPSPRTTFKDCSVCPEMVELPPGRFIMGSPADEVGRKQTEGPQRRVTIAKRFAIGKFEVTIDQFSAFVSETGLVAGSTCQVLLKFDGDKEVWGRRQASFLQPGFDVTGPHPAVCVSGHEAHAFAAWLKRRTGRPYRLPTEAEWEYAARAGSATNYSFGFDETSLCAHARFADLGSPFAWRGACRSESASAYGPLPVGSLEANPWGIADMHGNVAEWVEDCWTPDARKIPADGSPFARPGGCEVGVVRGGSFASTYKGVRSAHRRANVVAKQYQTVGFRVALPLDAP